jgi:hypothetical protein
MTGSGWRAGVGAAKRPRRTPGGREGGEGEGGMFSGSSPGCKEQRVRRKQNHSALTVRRRGEKSQTRQTSDLTISGFSSFTSVLTLSLMSGLTSSFGTLVSSLNSVFSCLINGLTSSWSSSSDSERSVADLHSRTELRKSVDQMRVQPRSVRKGSSPQSIRISSSKARVDDRIGRRVNEKFLLVDIGK